MQIIKELEFAERDALKEQHKDRRKFETHIKPIIDKTHCCVADISVADYSKIIICSCLPKTSLDHPYQPISEAIIYIQTHPEFLRQTADGCLDGQQVQYYLHQFDSHHDNLKSYFASLGGCFVFFESRKARNEVSDGMHRLVAYGLATNMNDIYFPIRIYYGTNENLDSL